MKIKIFRHKVPRLLLILLLFLILYVNFFGIFGIFGNLFFDDIKYKNFTIKKNPESFILVNYDENGSNYGSLTLPNYLNFKEYHEKYSLLYIDMLGLFAGIKKFDSNITLPSYNKNYLFNNKYKIDKGYLMIY